MIVNLYMLLSVVIIFLFIISISILVAFIDTNKSHHNPFEKIMIHIPNISFVFIIINTPIMIYVANNF